MSEEKTLNDIAEEIIGGSDGSFNIAVTDAYESLELDKQSEVDDLVGEQIDNCGCCGWNFYIDSMENSEVMEELICWRCADDERAELEAEENNEDCDRCGHSFEFEEMNLIEGVYVCATCETDEDEE